VQLTNPSILITPLNPYAARTRELKNREVPTSPRRRMEPRGNVGDKLASDRDTLFDWSMACWTRRHVGIPPTAPEKNGEKNPRDKESNPST